MIEQRIERAEKLLSETDLPIADIALRAGFASQSHFTTTFRKLACDAQGIPRNVVEVGCIARVGEDFRAFIDRYAVAERGFIPPRSAISFARPNLFSCDAVVT